MTPERAPRDRKGDCVEKTKIASRLSVRMDEAKLEVQRVLGLYGLVVGMALLGQDKESAKSFPLSPEDARLLGYGYKTGFCLEVRVSSKTGVKIDLLSAEGGFWEEIFSQSRAFEGSGKILVMCKYLEKILTTIEFLSGDQFEEIFSELVLILG